MEEGECVWVVCIDYGYNGLSDPVLAVRDEVNARATFAAMQKGGHETLVLFRVPLWPSVVNQATQRVSK